MPKLFTVNNDYHDSRFDKWFKKNVIDIPHSLIEKIIRQNKVKVNNKRTKSSYRVQRGDIIKIFEISKIKPTKNNTKIKYKPNKKELPGGNAKSFDWDIVKNLDINKPWFLSGGVNINNIQLIKSQIKPFGVDLSSGVEKELGIKDNHIINKFMSEFSNA